MVRYCKDCVYRVFEKNDRFRTCGFCLNSNVSCAEYIVTKNGLVSKTSIKIPKDCLPNCLCVQTYYDGECPYYESKVEEDEQ